MWERYGKGRDAVAIVSTLDKLVDSMPEEVTVGHVDYVDFKTESLYFSNLAARAFVKSRTLADEHEVRAVLSEPPVTKSERWSITIPPGEEVGHLVAVNLRTLITRVVLSPLSLGIRDRVSNALADAGFSVPVDDSEVVAPRRY
jgi:hypothetical protein